MTISVASKTQKNHSYRMTGDRESAFVRLLKLRLAMEKYSYVRYIVRVPIRAEEQYRVISGNLRFLGS